MNPTPLNEQDIDLLMEDVLHEVANPAPSSQLAKKLQQQTFSTYETDRSPIMTATSSNSNLLMFTPLDSTGGRGMSKTSVTIAMLFNIAAILLLAIQVQTKVMEQRHRLAELTLPMTKPIEPVREKVIPLKITPPKLPPMVEQPRIKLPDVKLETPINPVAVAAPKPVPTIAPAQPKIAVAAAAPKPVAVTMAAKSASVVNNDPHPAAVSLGHPDSPVPFQKSGSAVAAVNLNQGLSGMPPSNSGGGPPAKAVSLGNGQPGGTLAGNAPVANKGVKLGCTGCTGTGQGNGIGTQAAASVVLGRAAAPPPIPATVANAPARTAPQVLYKPKPAYTPEATALHLEGTVNVKIHVSATGVVTILGVAKGLGHGLDESAIQCAKGIRFKPAVDASGNPIDWEGVVTITFQMS